MATIAKHKAEKKAKREERKKAQAQRQQPAQKGESKAKSVETQPIVNAASAPATAPRVAPRAAISAPAPKAMPNPQPPKKEELPRTSPSLTVGPPAIKKETEATRGHGYALESHTVNGEILWTKIICRHPQSGEWISILCYRPTHLIAKFSEVEFEFTSFKKGNRDMLSAKNVVIISSKSELGEAMNYMWNPDTHAHPSGLRVAYLAEIAAKFLTHNHIGATLPERMKNFQSAIGASQIIGSISDSQLVTKAE